MSCEGCVKLVEKSERNALVYGLIEYQDRDGLKYPTKELVSVLIGLKRFVDIMLFHRKAITKPLESNVERAVAVLVDLPLLVCSNRNSKHRRIFLELLVQKFVKPLLSNHVLNIRNKSFVAKLYLKKPLSRKVLKM